MNTVSLPKLTLSSEDLYSIPYALVIKILPHMHAVAGRNSLALWFFFRRFILTLCSPWHSCCCHFYCPRKYFCLKSLHFQSLCTDREYSPKVTVWRKQQQQKRQSENEKFLKRWWWWNSMCFYTQKFVLEISCGLLGLTAVALQRQKPRE